MTAPPADSLTHRAQARSTAPRNPKAGSVLEVVKRGLALGVPLRVICRNNDVSHETVYALGRDDEAVAQALAEARDLGWDHLAYECLEIADDARNDWMERRTDKGVGYELNGEHIQRSKTRIETRLKLLAKWDPKRYGDKQQVEVTGEVTLSAILQAAMGHAAALTDEREDKA